MSPRSDQRKRARDRRVPGALEGPPKAKAAILNTVLGFGPCGFESRPLRATHNPTRPEETPMPTTIQASELVGPAGRVVAELRAIVLPQTGVA